MLSSANLGTLQYARHRTDADAPNATVDSNRGGPSGLPDSQTSIEKPTELHVSVAPNLAPPNLSLPETVRHRLDRIAHNDATVLIEGETGTGKTMLARLIHERSPRAGRPFIRVDCASLAEGIFESEIFGHVKGAFTGAATSRTGLIRTAEGGTLLLDEVSVLAASSQARLLTVVEDNSIRPLGSDKAVPVDVRFICVTNQHLPALVNAGHFREDLYYRCAQLVLRLPPVRDRPAEIPAIVHRLIWELLTDELRLSSGRSITLTANALAALRATHFPGNMRHLRNVLLRAIVETGGSVVDGHHISAAYADIPPVPAAAAVRRDGAPRQISPPERSHPLTPAAIESCLRATSWNKRKAAELLGVSRSTLYRKLHQYGMER